MEYLIVFRFSSYLHDELCGRMWGFAASKDLWQISSWSRGDLWRTEVVNLIVRRHLRSVWTAWWYVSPATGPREGMREILLAIAGVIRRKANLGWGCNWIFFRALFLDADLWPCEDLKWLFRGFAADGFVCKSALVARDTEALWVNGQPWLLRAWKFMPETMGCTFLMDCFGTLRSYDIYLMCRCWFGVYGSHVLRVGSYACFHRRKKLICHSKSA